jgi:hypothetical protein
MIWRQCCVCAGPFSPPDWAHPTCPSCLAEARAAAPPEAPTPKSTPQAATPVIPTGKREEAVVWLARQLDRGPLGAAEVVERAKVAGISQRTLRRAKTVLGVWSVRLGGVGAAGFWAWELPQEEHRGD